MKKDSEEKKLFFAFDIEANWLKYPIEKKMIDEKSRHLTLLFLGFINFQNIKTYLIDLPKLDLKIGAVGYFDKLLFLPQNHPRVLSFDVEFLEKKEKIYEFQKQLVSFFKERNFEINQKESFLPHVTICRDSFNSKNWKENFQRSSLYIKGFCLYESIENSIYNILWKKDFLDPFEEIKHTADIAFIVRGENFLDLLIHSFSAISFKDPKLINYIHLLKNPNSIDDVIINLNEIVTQAEIDGENISFKAISFHADIVKKDEILYWEMIVDV